MFSSGTSGPDASLDELKDRLSIFGKSLNWLNVVVVVAGAGTGLGGTNTGNVKACDVAGVAEGCVKTGICHFGAVCEGLAGAVCMMMRLAGAGAAGVAAAGAGAGAVAAGEVVAGTTGVVKGTEGLGVEGVCVVVAGVCVARH